MITNLLIFIFVILSIGFIIAYYADIVEQREFRRSLVPGMSVLIELDTGDKAIAIVDKVFHNIVEYGDNETTCELILMVDEECVRLVNVPINSVYKPNSYRI